MIWSPLIFETNARRWSDWRGWSTKDAANVGLDDPITEKTSWQPRASLALDSNRDCKRSTLLGGCDGCRFCIDVPCVWRNFPSRFLHDLGILVHRADARSERPALGKVGLGYTTWRRDTPKPCPEKSAWPSNRSGRRKSRAASIGGGVRIWARCPSSYSYRENGQS